MVGHTHEDIDQMFSCISRRLSKHDARTFPELKTEIGRSYSPIDVVPLTFMYNVKQWMESGSMPNLSGHVSQHQFKFELGDNGKAKAFYKKWSTTPSWSPEGGIELVKCIPKRQPELVPRETKNMCLDKLKLDLPKFKLQFDLATTTWWNSFIQSDGKLPDIPINPKWLLSMLSPANEDSSSSVAHNTIEQERVACELQRLVEKEEREVEVHVWCCLSTHLNM